jgi:hypothetical protein
MSDSQFESWLDLFLDEKDLDLDEPFEMNGPSGVNYLSYGAVVEAIKMTSSHEQEGIRKMLCKIDCANGDVSAYLRRLAQALVV